uniref:Type II toxin-antitoxin system PemK/MazF family toxin n=1 Tax=Heterorhabditis bacteriophora TaxID=37862 RepID=A0A1I7X4A6_HETBA
MLMQYPAKTSFRMLPTVIVVHENYDHNVDITVITNLERGVANYNNLKARKHEK